MEEFSDLGSFADTILAHAKTCSGKMPWLKWRREAYAVARGYRESKPPGNQPGLYGEFWRECNSMVHQGEHDPEAEKLE